MNLNCLILICLVQSVLCSNNTDNRTRKAKLVRKLKRIRQEGAVRLVGGTNSNEGNIEIYHNSGWSSVCDDEWDMREARVVCKQLGLGPPISTTYSSQFGQLQGGFAMDNLQCSGKELNLTECRFDGWYNHDCGADEVAGVICSGKDINVTTTLKPNQSLRKYTIREVFGSKLRIELKDGRTANEGKVEISTDNFPALTAICGEGWSLIEAQVICRSLGLGYAQMATQTSFITSENEMKVGLENVECRGNESTLADCLTTSLLPERCPPHNVAGVICTHYLADLVINYEEIVRSAYLEDRPLYLLRCAMEENCLASSAYGIVENSHTWHLETRRLLRFTASILNAGNAEFTPALPKHLWEFHLCHMHYHSMEVFASFDIYDGNKKVAEGHKASFCLEDNKCLQGVKPKFACANYGDQGISVNCSDIYKHNIDCQWIDISEIDPGIYTLKIAVNPELKVAEMSFHNNAAVCQLFYGQTSVHISNCYLDRP